MPKPNQVAPKGASRNAGLTAHEADPWQQNPFVSKMLAEAELPESHGAPLRRFQEIYAQIEWGGDGYEAGSLEACARDLQVLPIDPSLGVNLHVLSNLLSNCEDLVISTFPGPEGRPLLLLGIDGLIDTDRMEHHVMEPLRKAMVKEKAWQPVPDDPDSIVRWLQEQVLSAVSIHSMHTIGAGVATVLQGDLLILVDGFSAGAFVSVRGWAERGVSEPTTEPAVHAPKEAFTESIRTMTALVRRRIHSPLLRTERFLIGTQSPTPVDLLYIQGITSPDLIHEARARLSRIQVDALLTSGKLEELIEDQPSALFPQIFTTERPDRVAASLMEGQIAIMMDGVPNAKVAPVSFTHFMTAPDDYEERFPYATFIQWVRFFFLAIVLVGPAIYVSVLSIHPDMLPTRVLISLAAARLGIPYPTLVEMFLMELLFEGMREATALLPRTMGGAITVVGGLVIGQGAISSGLASPATVVVVALTGIAAFTIPSYSLTTGLRVVRFGFLLSGAFFGLYGVTIAMLLLLLHLSSLRSFGRPYLQPLSPLNMKEMLDTLMRAPFWALDRRPEGNRPLNPRRNKQWLKPGSKQ